MNTEEKTYYLWGYEIKRKYHYVDAYHHYGYIAMGKTFSTLAAAKKYISDELYCRKS